MKHQMQQQEITRIRERSNQKTMEHSIYQRNRSNIIEDRPINNRKPNLLTRLYNNMKQSNEIKTNQKMEREENRKNQQQI